MNPNTRIVLHMILSWYSQSINGFGYRRKILSRFEDRSWSNGTLMMISLSSKEAELRLFWLSIYFYSNDHNVTDFNTDKKYVRYLSSDRLAYLKALDYNLDQIVKNVKDVEDSCVFSKFFNYRVVKLVNAYTVTILWYHSSMCLICESSTEYAFHRN